jgi:hypothetical protein
LEKITARTNAVFGEIMAKLEILLQHYNCSPRSSHGATNSSEEIASLEPPLNVNLPIHDEIRSSAKQIEVAAKQISESSPSLEPYSDNLVTDSMKIVDDLSESALDSVQRIGEFQREDGFEVQCDTNLTVNTMGDCNSGITATPEMPNAKPITTHSLHNEDTSQFGESQRKVTDDDVAGNRGLSLQCEIPFALYLTSISDNRASIMKPKFQLHWDDLFTKHKLVLVSIYGNLAVDITGIQYDSRLIPPDKFLERLLDRAHPYGHKIFVVGVTQDLHGWNSQIKFYAQSGLLNFVHHMFAEMCEQGILSWTDLTLGSVARINGWKGKQVQSDSDLTSLRSFTRWYETPLQENRLIKVPCYSPKANGNVYIKVVHQIGCIIIDVRRVHNLGAKTFGALSTTKQASDSRMSCFLPLAKVMSLELCQYFSKKKYVLLEQQPTNISKWIHNAKKALVTNLTIDIIPNTGQCQEDMRDYEEKGDDHHDSSNISAKGCGMLPNLYIRNLLCLLNILFEVKMIYQAPSSSVCIVTIPKKISYIRLLGTILIVKKAWKKIHKVKLKCGDRVIELTEIMSSRYAIAVSQFCNHIENMSQNASQSFKIGDSMLVSGFNHNIHTLTWLIACQLLEERLSAALGIKVTTPLCVVSILPLNFARTWCTATSLLQPYNQPHFSTIFAAIRKLMCANFSNILVTEDVMSVMFGFWLWLLGDNLIFLTRQSKKWDPGGCSIVHKKDMLNLELTLGVTTLIQQHYLNFNLEDKVGFKGDGNVMILKEKTMSSNEDTKFVITVRTRGRGMHIKE